MKTVAVISEYNPFHMGHARQFKEIRKSFGDDCAIVAIMSGNFVQRGAVAVMGKFDRAACAVEAGASLVLELPFPFCAASAEHFAKAGVSIANDLGAVDALSFGSECGDILLLSKAAQKLNDPMFERFFKERLRAKNQKDKGYARLLSEALCECFGDAFPSSFFLPNNILAISYISALKKLHSSIVPHTVFRKGTDEDAQSEDILAGATHIRKLLFNERIDAALAHIPSEVHPILLQALDERRAPVREGAFAPMLLSHLRLSDAGTLSSLAECGGGVSRLLKKSASAATDYETLVSGAVTKKYTAARVRRALLYAYFGVTPAQLTGKPLYTQVLAMDEKGKRVLAHIRKTANISILTKAADLHKIPPAAREMALFSYRADSVYALLSPQGQRADAFLCTSPYRKECR